MRVVLLLGLLAQGLRCLPAQAAEEAGSGEREYAIKAAFLYHFASYVTWPQGGSAKATDEPFVIGVLGADPFGAILDDLAKAKLVDGRKVAIRRFKSVADCVPCPILFISSSDAGRLDLVLHKLGASPTLLIADTQSAATRGVHINFFIENNKVRFEVNAEAAQRTGLKISSKLLRLARIVESGKGGS